MAKRKVRPLHDNVVVRRSEREEKTEGGIIIPDNARKKSRRGEVLAVGLGRWLESGDRVAVGVSPGEVVTFGEYAGTEVEVDGDELLILKESELLAVDQ